ncbi:cyclase family protein [Haloferacaceae archaeon DSL9]
MTGDHPPGDAATHDLSHPIETGMPVYPGDPSVRVDPAANIEDDGFRVAALELGSHAGTHIDAPAHTEPAGRTLDDFSIGTFRFDARLVDCRPLEPREPIPVYVFEAALDGVDLAAPRRNRPDMLVLRTGWERYWGTDRYVDHPYLSREAAAWCADRGFHVALDALNVDPTPGPQTEKRAHADESSDVPAHRELLGADRLIVENLRGLDPLPARFTLLAHPLAIRDADGSPVRAVAVVDTQA